MPSTRSIRPTAGLRGRWVKTVDDALRYVEAVGVCLIFEKKSQHGIPALWDVVDAPDKRPDERGFGERVSLVWRLKNELPMAFPDAVFYGKLRNGRAMLCTLEKLTELYREQHRQLAQLSPEANRIHSVVRTRPVGNRELRAEAGFDGPGGEARFNRALQELQIAMQIARVDVDPDTWLPFDWAYPRIGSPPHR